MLTTVEAAFHIDCQFALKGGEFLLDSSTPNEDGGMHLVFRPLSGEGNNRTSDMTAEGMDQEMWSLTLCNNPAEHG